MEQQPAAVILATTSDAVKAFVLKSGREIRGILMRSAVRPA
jgi:hypothetical protein